jgi:hypothetical protein
LESRSRSRFSVIQAMVMVAASAPGLAMTRALPGYLGTYENFQIYNSIVTTPGGQSSGGWGHQTPGSGFSTLGRPLRDRASYWLGHIPYWSGPCLVCWSLAATGLALRGPRARPPGRLAGHAGSVTGLAVAVATAAVACRAALYRAASPTSPTSLWQHPEAFISYFWIGLPRAAGYTVAVWWLALTLRGCGSRGPGPGSRLGSALGWCWMAMAVSSEVGLWCYALNY